MDIYLKERIKERTYDLNYDLNALIDDLEELDEITQFDKEDAEKLIRAYKSELERQGLWSDDLEKHFDLFLQFDLNKILNSII